MTEIAHNPVTPVHENSDAYWCGWLSGTLRQIADPECMNTAEGLRSLAQKALAEYDRREGHLPPNAKFLAYFGVEAAPPPGLLHPGERVINGSLYFSDSWL